MTRQALMMTLTFLSHLSDYEIWQTGSTKIIVKLSKTSLVTSNHFSYKLRKNMIWIMKIHFFSVKISNEH